MIAFLLACAADPAPSAPRTAVAAAQAAPAPPPAPAPKPASRVEPAAPLVAPEPGPDPKTSTAFVFLGDAGKGSAGQRHVAEAVKAWCAARRCDFVAYLGDNLYPTGATSAKDPIFKEKFEAYWEGFGGPFMVALGNHDHMGSWQAELDYAKTSKKWKMPARWYDFRQGVAEFFVLDTGPSNDGGAVEGEQLTWLKARMAEPKPPWRVAYGHHPIHSSGLHGNSPRLVEVLDPALRDGGVDFWLCGHDHHLEVLDDTVTPIEIVSGGGGDARKVNPPVPESVYLAPSLGFGYLVLDPIAAQLAMVEVSVDGASKVAYTSRWESATLERSR